MSYAVKDGDNWYQMNPPDAREGDEHQLASGDWLPVSIGDREVCKRHPVCQIRRPIDPNLNSKPGEKWRIVGLEEYFPIGETKRFQATKDGITWSSSLKLGNFTIEEYLVRYPHILAIRVRVEQEWRDKNQKHCPKCKADVTHLSSTDKWCPQCSAPLTTEAERIVKESQPDIKTRQAPIGSGPVPVESNTRQEVCECGHKKQEHDIEYFACYGNAGILDCRCQQFKPKARKEGDIRQDKVWSPDEMEQVSALIEGRTPDIKFGPQPTTKESDAKGPLIPDVNETGIQVPQEWLDKGIKIWVAMNYPVGQDAFLKGWKMAYQPPSQPISASDDVELAWLKYSHGVSNVMDDEKPIFIAGWAAANAEKEKGKE